MGLLCEYLQKSASQGQGHGCHTWYTLVLPAQHPLPLLLVTGMLILLWEISPSPLSAVLDGAVTLTKGLAL